MSGPNQVNINLNVQSNLKDANKDASQLNNTLKQAAQAAQGVNVPRGTAGSRAVAAGAQPVGAQAVMEYGQLRGSAGATGASARDFANQAQGLGGLVRLYATYAANIFAVSAAFSALSNAMDTTNMVKGLDQLGAAGGKALGALSKSLVAATGGAISLREAMTATAQASAAGMSGENILRLGAAATKASQALGVSLPDAVSRLSRGITKIEPELLDELGIFVKIEEVTTRYATSVGKTAASITDFERRQAFANAVLDQAEKKFGAIKIDTNPYTKLAAATKDTAQSVLELVNVGLVPLVNLLSSSPTALLAVFGAIAVKLTKSAIPAIADYKAALEGTKKDSAAKAAARAEEAIAAQKSINDRIQALNEQSILAKEAAIDASERRILGLRKGGLDKVSSLYKLLEAPDIMAVSDTRLNRVEKVIAGRQAQGRITASDAGQGMAAVRELKAAKDANFEYIRGGKELQDSLEKQKQGWGTLGQTIRISAAAQKQATADSIISNTANIASTLGVTSAFKSMQQQLKTENITGVSKAFLVMKGSMAAVGAASITLLGALGPILGIIGLIVAAGALFIDWMSNTRDESEATGKSLTSIKDATKNLADTLDVINKKPLLEQFDPQSVAAKATALNTLGDSLRKVFEDTGKEIAKMNFLDKTVDFVKVLWGGDAEGKLVAATSKGLANAFKAIDENSGAGKAASATIKNLLKVDNLESVDQISAALKKMGSAEVMSALQEITTLIQNIGKESVISAAKTTELVDSFIKVGETRKKVQNEFIAQDPFSQYGQALIDSSFKLSTALEDPAQKLNALIVLGKEIGSLPVSQGTILDVKSLAASASELQSVNTEIFNIDKQIGELEARKSGITLRTDSALKEVASLNSEIDKLKQRGSQKILIQTKLTTEVEQKSKAINTAQLEVFRTGAEIVSNKLSAEFAKAGNTINMAVAGVLSGTQSGIDLRAKAEKDMLAAQADQIKVQRASIIAIEKNSIAVAEGTLSRDRERLESLRERPERAGGDALSLMNALVLSISKQESALKGRNELVSSVEGKPAGDGRGLFKKVASSPDATKEQLAFAQSLEGTAAALANIAAQTVAVSIAQKDRSIALRFEEQRKTLDNKLKELQVEKSLLDISKETNSETNLAALKTKQTLENKISLLAFDAEQLNFKVLIARYEAVSNATETQKIKTRQKEAEQIRAIKVITESLRQDQEVIVAQAKIEEKLRQDRQVAESRSLDIRTQQVESQEKLLEAQRASGILLESDYINQKGSIDIAQARLAFEQSTLAAKQSQENSLAGILLRETQLTAEIKARKQEDEKTGKPVQDRTAAEIASQRELAKERDRINATYDSTAQKANSVLATNLAVVEATKQNAFYQEQWNKSLQNTQGIAEALATAFGNVGKSLADVAISMAQVARNQADSARGINSYTASIEKARAEAAKLYEIGANDAGDQAAKRARDAIKARSELQKKADKDELMGYARIAGASKQLFAQKTAAYKVLAATEKALSLARLAMDAAEITSSFAKMATTVKTTGTGIVANMAEAGARGVNAIAGAFSLPPPAGFIAGAAMTAIIGGLLGKAFGGGKSSGPPPVSAADRQATTGTAMGYDSNNQKTQVRAGVFGDTSAKSASIANSLEIVAKNSQLGLGNDSKMLAVLEALRDALETAAKQLYRVSGIAGGSAFGTTEGSSQSRSFFGLFGGGGKSTEIIDSGIKLAGTFKQMTESGNGLIQLYETSSTTTTRGKILGFGGGSSTSINTQVQELPEAAAKALRQGFSAAEAVLYETAETANVSVAAVTQVLENLPVNEIVSLRGLKGQELSDAISALMSGVLDDASTKIFAGFEQYQKFGEGMLETATRVTSANRIVNAALQQANIGDALLMLGRDVTEGIAKLYGGADKFAGAIRDWNNRFLTDQEKDAARRARLGRTLAKYGIDSVKDQKSYIELVKQLRENPAEVGSTKLKELQEAGQDFGDTFDFVTQKIKEQTDAQQSAYDNLKSAVTSLKDLSKSLGDAKQSLLLGAESTLSPGDKYGVAKASFQTTATLARAGDIESRKALPQSITTFLAASRVMFASSEEYTKDFNAATAALDEIKALNDQTVNKADLALAAALATNEKLANIDTNTGNANTNIEKLIMELTAKTSAVATATVPAVGAGGQTALAIVSKPAPTFSDIVSSYTSGYTWGKDGLDFSGSASAGKGLADLFAQSGLLYDPSSLFAAGKALGSNYIPEDMISLIHAGERILPAADNRELMQFLSTNNNNGGLYQEICRLNAQVEQLTKVVAEGAIMNAQATDRNTQELADTMQQTTDQAVYAQRLQSRTGIV